MAMAVAAGGMAEQHLDYNARLISVRRQYNLALDAESYDSARSSDVEEDIPEEKERAMEFGRSPGAVPFVWERAPGVAKAEIAGARDLRGVPAAIGNLRPPPAAGRSFSPVPLPREEEKAIVQGKGMAVKEEEKRQDEEETDKKEVEEKLVETVKPAWKGKSAGPRGRKRLEPAEEVASTRAFADRVASRSFFGEIALSAISETPPKGTGAPPARVGERKGAPRGARPSFGSSSNLFFESPSGNFVSPARGPDQNGVKMQQQVQRDDADLFSDASETFPRTSYAVSSVSGSEGQRPDADPDTRENILQKFLPAAGALVAERQVERAAAKDTDRAGGSRDHSSSPLSRVGFSPQQGGFSPQRGVHARPASRFAAVKQTGKVTGAELLDDDDGADNVSVLASKMGCGLLPRVMGRALRHTATPCFPFKTRARAKAKDVTRTRSPAPFPSARSTFEDDSQFDDAYSEFWDEEEEEEFLDRRLMEVRETEEQLKFPGRSPPIGAPRFDVNQKASHGETMLAITSPSSGYTSSSLVVVQAGNAWVDKESESSEFSASPEANLESGPAGHLRDNPTTFPVHQDARGFLGLPRNRAPEPELAPRRAAAYREYFHHEPRTSSGKGSPFTAKTAGELQGRNRLEDFLRLERWNQPEAKDMDVQTWVNHTSGHLEAKEVESTSEPQLSLSEEAEHAQSSRSSGEASFCGSEVLSFTSDPKSSETSSGTCVSTDQEDLAVKGWPLGTVQTYRHRKRPDKESPVSVLPNSLPPLPPSPSESWLWANLAASPLNSQKASQLVLSKKYFDHGGSANPETNSKWQLVVRSENSHPADRLRFSEELRDTSLFVGGGH